MVSHASAYKIQPEHTGVFPLPYVKTEWNRMPPSRRFPCSPRFLTDNLSSHFFREARIHSWSWSCFISCFRCPYESFLLPASACLRFLRVYRATGLQDSRPRQFLVSPRQTVIYVICPMDHDKSLAMARLILPSPEWSFSVYRMNPAALFCLPNVCSLNHVLSMTFFLMGTQDLK